MRDFKFLPILMAVLFFNILVYGGGDILPPKEVIEDIQLAEEVVPLELPKEELMVVAKELPELPIKKPPLPKKILPEEVQPVKALPVESSPPVVFTPPPMVMSENIITPLGYYVAVGLTLARFDPSCSCPSPISDADKTVGFVGRIGYDFNQYFGIEARGVQSNWYSNGGKVKHMGAFLKPMYPISSALNIYALGGYGKTTTSGSKQHVNARALAWGVGFEYDFSSDEKEGRYDREFDGAGDQESGFGIFADYERLLQKSGSPDLDTVSIGITYDF